MAAPSRESVSLFAGGVAALGASSCCVLPLVLVSAGLGGAWLAQLRAMDRYFPVFVAAAALAFGYGFYRLYLRRADCGPEGACAEPGVRRRQRIAFWATLIAAKALLLSPYVVAALAR